MKPMTARLAAVAAILAGAAWLSDRRPAEARPTTIPLAGFPTAIEQWTGHDAPRLDAAAIRQLGVDDYINRIYSRDGASVGLYIGFHESQRQGDTLHSPLNCLPGSGWQPLGRDYVDIATPDGGRAAVNRYVIQKGLDHQVVFYWYQSQGRVIASEYAGKFFLVYDAMRRNRTDGALVRVVSPMSGAGDSAELAATRVAVDFVKAAFPMLTRYLPS